MPKVDEKTSQHQTYAARLILAGTRCEYKRFIPCNILELNSFASTPFEPVQQIYGVGYERRFQIACIQPDGNPTPTIHWQRDGQIIPSSGRVR